MEFLFADLVFFLEFSEDSTALGGVDPEIHVGRSFAESFFAGITSEVSETFVDVEVRPVGEDVDAEGVGAPAERGGKDLLGALQSEFGGTELPGDALLLSVGKDEAESGTEERCGDG